jgi:TatD DNase family protein
LAPEPYRGKTNEPSLIPYTAAEVAEILGMETDRLLSATAATAHGFFGLDS